MMTPLMINRSLTALCTVHGAVAGKTAARPTSGRILLSLQKLCMCWWSRVDVMQLREQVRHSRPYFAGYVSQE
jgi:hypothetical protein